MLIILLSCHQHSKSTWL